MPRLVATEELYHYAEGRTYHPGEEFDANDHETLVLTQVLKKAKVADAPAAAGTGAAKASSQTYRTAAVTPEADAPKPETQTTDNSKPLAQPQRQRRYPRRDMRAED